MKRSAQAAQPAVDPILSSVLGPDAAQLPPELAERVAEALRASAAPVANAPQADESIRSMASRSGLLSLLVASNEEIDRYIDTVDWLLCSIRHAAQQDGTWAAALCDVGSYWVVAIKNEQAEFNPLLAGIRQRVERDEREARA